MTALGTRSLKIKLGTAEMTGELSAVRIVSGESDSDFTTFADAAAGGARKYTLTGTAVQDPGNTASLWSQVWTASGTTASVVISPYGATSASATAPFFTGTVVIKEPDGDLLGGDADASTTSRMTMDIEWDFEAKPVKTTSGAF